MPSPPPWLSLWAQYTCQWYCDMTWCKSLQWQKHSAAVSLRRYWTIQNIITSLMTDTEDWLLDAPHDRQVGDNHSTPRRKLDPYNHQVDAAYVTPSGLDARGGFSWCYLRLGTLIPEWTCWRYEDIPTDRNELLLCCLYRIIMPINTYCLNTTYVM